MRVKMLWVLTVMAVTVTTMAVAAVRVDEIPEYNASKYSQKVTGCDLLAGHPNDPYKVVVGLEKRDMDLPAAIAACKVAVERDPKNPRLNYQLARVYGYSGQGEKALPYRATALATGYPQAMMVYGFLYHSGWNKMPLDKCLAGELQHRSALHGLASTRFVWWALEGDWDGCSGVKVDLQEMLGFLDAADKGFVAGSSDPYPKAINDMLRDKIKARMAKKK